MSRIGLGTAPLGNLFEAVDDDESIAVVHAAWERGVRFFDTAPLYGHGLAERRLGRALASCARDEAIVCTKVGRVLDPATGARPDTVFRDVPPVDPVYDYSRDGVLRSIEESLERMGLDRFDIVHVHDPDDHEHEALATAFPTLIELRDQGVISRVGCGMNQVAMLSRFVDAVDLDCILLAGRWTLLDRTGAALLAQCAARGVDVILGGVFNSGLLASANPELGATFDYTAAPPALVAQARRLADVCASFGVTLPAAAIQFALRTAGIDTVLVGARSVDEISADLDFAAVPIPDALWAAVDDLHEESSASDVAP
jgi:D-threo-aldose 1-dehydrogenase